MSTLFINIHYGTYIYQVPQTGLCGNRSLRRVLNRRQVCTPRKPQRLSGRYGFACALKSPRSSSESRGCGLIFWPVHWESWNGACTPSSSSSTTCFMIVRPTSKAVPQRQFVSALVEQVQALAAVQPAHRRLRDDRGNRFYLFEGPEARPLPSVTSVLSTIAKPALTTWSRNTALEAMRDALLRKAGKSITNEILEQALQEAKQQPRALAGRAAQLGIRGHEAFGRVLSGLGASKPVTAELDQTVSNFERWWKHSGYVLACSELVVRSERYGYAGQCDAIAVRLNEGVRTADESSSRPSASLAVFDWKTTSAIYSEYALQAAAYAKALEEMSHGTLHVHEAWVVRFGRMDSEPCFEARQVRDISAAFLCFRAALILFNELGETLYNDKGG
jgi:hypothetical protein